MYFRFLLEKIASRIHEQQLQQELVGIVERERRPLADYLQLQNEVAKAKQHPSDVGFMSLLLGSRQVRRTDPQMRAHLRFSFFQHFTPGYAGSPTSNAYAPPPNLLDDFDRPPSMGIPETARCSTLYSRC